MNHLPRQCTEIEAQRAQMIHLARQRRACGAQRAQMIHLARQRRVCGAQRPQMIHLARQRRARKRWRGARGPRIVVVPRCRRGGATAPRERAG
jgi:hypothetical protein